MEICPICNQEYTGCICYSCGYDSSLDYEQYPTLQTVSETRSLISRQKDYTNRQEDVIRCPKCQNIRFRLIPSNKSIICCNCNYVTPFEYFSFHPLDRQSQKRNSPIAAGVCFTLGVKSDGSAVSAGEINFGQSNASLWTDIVAVSAGVNHVVGLKTDGTVVAVGDNSCGQCNTIGWDNIIAISAGAYHTVGLRNDGTVVAVGNNHTIREQCKTNY